MRPRWLNWLVRSRPALPRSAMPNPTVPYSGPVVFHCPACKTPVESRATRCPWCGAALRRR